MGNVACCKKPNELIEDKDVFKKSTIIKTNDIQVEQIEPKNPFQKVDSRQPNKYNSQENPKNNLLDLEETKITNNIQYSQNIEHINTNGPSDNLRKKRPNKLLNNSDLIVNKDYNNIKTRNILEQVQISTNSEYNKMENKDNNINTLIRSSDEAMMEKAPQDKMSYKTNSNNLSNNETLQLKEIPSDKNPNINTNENIDKRNLFNSERMPSNEEKFLEKKIEIINTDLPNNVNQIEKAENLSESNNNINNKEIIENKIITEKAENTEQKLVLEQSPQEQLNPQENIKTNINNKNPKNINNIDEEPQNSIDKDNLNINYIINNNSNPTYTPQNIIKTQSKTDSQLPDEEDPKDTNELNPNINKTNSKSTNNNNSQPQDEEITEQKEAFLQSADGEIIPTQQISDSEIALLYQHCQSKGEAEPDDDFNFETYKRFYPADDPFFLFDKGEVSDGQIISSPDEMENLEIYEGEINEGNKKHGQGILTTPEFVRKGTWRNGEFTGWGRESRRNKEVLEGKFINGLLNGKGIFKNSKNNIYIGDFVNSKREGVGELYTNRIHYIGEFKEDKLNGKGIIEFLKEGHKYEGDFKNNEINGRGIFQWKNGDIYQGDMTDGKMNGIGIYKYANGEIYEGEYINGIREGKGRIIVNNNVIFDGEFRGGHRVIRGRLTSSTRATNKGNVDNNEENNENIPNN